MCWTLHGKCSKKEENVLCKRTEMNNFPKFIPITSVNIIHKSMHRSLFIAWDNWNAGKFKYNVRYWWIASRGDHVSSFHIHYLFVCLFVCLFEFAADGRAQWHIKNAEYCNSMWVRKRECCDSGQAKHSEVPRREVLLMIIIIYAPSFDIAFLRGTAA